MDVAGFGTDFDADSFRSNIKNVMKMSAPSAVEMRVTFRWDVDKTYVGRVDPSGRPYDLAAANVVSVSGRDDKQVDCAVEIVNRVPSGSAIGEFNNPRATLTLLDVDYERIEGATKVLIGGNLYRINWVEPVGLFSVTVWTLHAQAESES